LEACTWYVMRECFALSKRIPAEAVDMKELFPVSRDFSKEFAHHVIRRGIGASAQPTAQSSAIEGNDRV
ncbi:MAG: 1-acyl-sn-glycerol-3-phosphate acyltransferase, partial [Raoultibacter sp.]